MKRALIVGMLLLASLSTPAWAKPDTPREVRQKNFNATLVVSDPQELSARLNQMASRNGATVQSFSMDSSSTSANCNLQCPPGKLDGLLAEIPKLGRVENQSMSTSDYTSSYRDAANRVRVYEALSLVSLDKTLQSTDLSPAEQALARAELSQMVRERIQSYQSSMNSYLDYNNRAQVSLSFRIVRAEEVNQVKPSQPTPEAGTTAPSQPASTPVNQGTLLPLYLLGFVNLTFLWLMARKAPVAPATPPPPGTHD